MRRGGRPPLTKRERLLRLRFRRLLFTLTLTLGLAIMLYPMCMRMYFSYRSVKLAEEYAQTMVDQPDERLEQLWAQAQAYNRGHRTNHIDDPFSTDELAQQQNAEYAALLDPMGTGVMGYLDIPRIDQRLNVYHGTDSDTLEQGVGHLQGTSLPVGGETSHCVLSAHRGLPVAKLFTDLDQLRAGDLVYLRILGHTLAYRVDGSQVVLPDEIDALDIRPGEDLLTLVTCTPYAVNTHRLLVTCHAVPYVEAEDLAQNMGLMVRARLALLAAAIAVCLAIAFMTTSQLVEVRREQVRPHGRHEA